jgi:hypothetical protein
MKLSRCAVVFLMANMVCTSPAFSEQSEEPSSSAAPVGAADNVSPAAAASAWHARQGSSFQRNWGVDIIGVKAVSSGSNLRFTYRVLDANKAAQLNDKKANPVLIDEKTGARFVIPQMPKVGQLRQTATPKVGQIYWMIFANGGKALKRGDRVDVVIGRFRADGMVVE